MCGAEGRADLASSLRLAVLRLGRRLGQESTAAEITPSQLSALTILAKHGELTLGELAALEQVAPPSMTRIASRLEAAGLLERRPDGSDRRVVRVALSASGAGLLEGGRERGDAYMSGRLSNLSESDAEALARALPVLERLAAAEER
jgi:DNA-binding MarR family transcriptional regulator